MRIMMEDNKDNDKMLNMLGARYVEDERNPSSIKPNDYVIFKKWGKERLGLVQSLGEEFGMVEDLTPEDLWSTEVIARAAGVVETPTYEEFRERPTIPAPPKEHTLGRASMWKPYRYIMKESKQRQSKLIAVVRLKTGHYEKVYLEDCRPIEK